MKREDLRQTKKDVVTAGLTNWSVYFNKKLNKELGKMYAEIMLPYSLKSIEIVIEQIMETCERFPTFSQVRTLIKGLEDVKSPYGTHHKATSGPYPVENLHKALDILLKRGRDEFDSFCKNTGMPGDDRDRVMTRAEIISHNQGRKTSPSKPGNTLNSLIDKVGRDVSDHVRDGS